VLHSGNHLPHPLIEDQPDKNFAKEKHSSLFRINDKVKKFYKIGPKSSRNRCTGDFLPFVLSKKSSPLDTDFYKIFYGRNLQVLIILENLCDNLS